MVAGMAASGAALAQQADDPVRDAAAPPQHDDDPIVIEGDEGFVLALQLLVASEDWQGVLDLLEARPDLAGRPDAVRLKAELLRRVGRERESIALLEGLLTRNPDDALARLQLAEAHFANRRDQSAALAYRLALSGELDPVRVQLASARLSQLADRRRWRFWVGASVAPDSNINSATDATRVDLFGLPFELDDNARRQSGVAFSAFGGVERRFIVNDDWAIRADLAGSILEASGAAFDTASLSAHAGPEWRVGPTSFLSLQASTGAAWFGGDLLERRAGVLSRYEISAQQTLWSGAVSLDGVDDELNDGRDGLAASADIVRTRYLSPAMLWRASASLGRRDADAASESYTQLRSSVALLVPGPFSTLAYFEPYALGRTYDGAAAAFGEVREDLELGVGVRLSKRDWVVMGGFPFMELSLARNNSTIALNDYTRERIGFGFTRSF